MADIFISYASEDRARIEPLVGLLESAGYSVWWDRQLKGGTQFSAEIESALTDATVVLVTWSPNSIKSRWVADEADLALETGNLLPVSLDGARSPMGFRQLQTVDFSDWTGGEAPCVSALMVALEHHLKSGERTSHHAVALPAISQTKSDASIAVLPFVNMSSDPEQDYFSDGISEELLNLLAKIRELTVIARTSSFAFKGSNKSISEIGAILGVAYVLEGSIRKAGNRVRITAQLIETRNSSHLWSETYDRTLEDIFAIQDEISAAIVEELKEYILRVDEVEAPIADRTSNVEAYEHYLMGQQLLNKRTRETIQHGRREFELALALDPDFAPALVGLADAHLLLNNTIGFYGTTQVKEARALAKPILDRALEIDPESAEIYTVFAMFEDIGGSHAQACAYAERAIALNPNHAPAYRTLAFAMEANGDPTAPIFSTDQKTLQLDPLSIADISNLAIHYIIRARYRDAEELLNKIRLIDPDSPFHDGTSVLIPFVQGRYKDALNFYSHNDELCRQSNRRSTLQEILTLMAHGPAVEHIDQVYALTLYCASGLLDEANNLGPELAARPEFKGDYRAALAMAMWHTRTRHYKEALECLKSFDEEDSGRWGQHFSAHLDYTGALYSCFLRKVLGDHDGAQNYLAKIKELYQNLAGDPDGITHSTYRVGAYVALADGDVGRALNQIEDLMERSPGAAHDLLMSPFFEETRLDPKFNAIASKAMDKLNVERQAAINAGLLPPSDRLIALTKE